jgi:hypothetical protein
MTKTKEDHMDDATERLAKLCAIRNHLNAAISNVSEAALTSHAIWDSWPSYYRERPTEIEASIKVLEMTERNVRDQIFATVDQIVNLLSERIAEVARASTEPVLFVTGNAYMPPARSFPPAEAVYQADNDGDVWEHFTEALWGRLEDLSILMEAPEYDNSLYVVDLARWERREESEIEDADSLDGEWMAKPEFS